MFSAVRLKFWPKSHRLMARTQYGRLESLSSPLTLKLSSDDDDDIYELMSEEKFCEPKINIPTISNIFRHEFRLG